MLIEWLEKEASQEMTKTAAQQFEDELAALDAKDIVRVWREAKNKEAQIGQRLMQAVPGAVGGAIGGAGLGALGGAVSAPSGERWDAAGQGALLGAGLGAVGGGISGASVNPKRMQAASDLRRQLIGEITGTAPARGSAKRTAELLDTFSSPRSGGELAGGAMGTLGSLGAVGAGVREGLKKRKEKEKKSSVDLLRMAAMRRMNAV